MPNVAAIRMPSSPAISFQELGMLRSFSVTVCVTVLVSRRHDGGEESGAACSAAGGGPMVGARRAGRLGAGAGGRDVLAAGARALGLLHRLRQTTHAPSPEMRLCERRAGDCAGRVRRRRGARGNAQREGSDCCAPTGPWKPRDASPRRRLDGTPLRRSGGGSSACSGRGVRGRGARRCLRVGCAARLTITLTE